jgi:hypothetical protein
MNDGKGILYNINLHIPEPLLLIQGDDTPREGDWK